MCRFSGLIPYYFIGNTKELKMEMNQPKFPRLDPPYRVFWNWEISYKCNYKCSYCSFWKKEEEGINYGVRKWEEIWNGIFDKYGSGHIRFSGGEPSIYPEFIELLEALSKKHTLEISTNLTFDIDKFFEKVKPENIMISSSFHPEFIELEAFLEKASLVKKKGYDLSITYVAYPSHLQTLQETKIKVEKKGIKFIIQQFSGKFQGRIYPEEYSETERDFLNKIVNNSLHQAANVRIYNWKAKKRETKGRLCRMGQMYAKVFPDGRVYRCCASKTKFLGNLLDKNFRLLDKPEPCKAEQCPCWKGMLVGFEEDIWLPLWNYPEHTIYKILPS
jgi:MoaA/NifB/PqqE/SkfB family radical SAM enzyme